MESSTTRVVKTKIVATAGPACETVERLAELVRAGVSVFRLNMSHGEHAWHGRTLERIREAAGREQRPVAVLFDLGGPKIRLGPVPGGPVWCEPGQQIVLGAKPAKRDDGLLRLTLDPPELVERLADNDRVLLADGTVALRCERREPGGEVVCRVRQPGEIRSGCGVNLPGVDLPVEALTEDDLRDLRWVATQDPDYVGLSFVRRPGDVRRLRKELERLDCAAGIVAKIERQEALDALDEIVEEADAVMVARGDLGVEIDLARVAVVQKDVIRRCNRAGVPVITATQMLESMRTNRRPTRAEATDVANAVLDGTDALMLSAETAIGEHPLKAVEMMARIAHEAESLLPGATLERRRGDARRIAQRDPERAIVEGASLVAERIGGRVIVMSCRSGSTARALSALRGSSAVLAVGDGACLRRMSLYWGVVPVRLEAGGDATVDGVLERARRDGLLRPDEPVVLLDEAADAGTGRASPGVKIERLGG